MKYFEPTYYIFLMGTIISWLLSSVDVMSKLAALVLAILSIVFLYRKIQGQVLDNKKKQKELEEE